MQLRPMFIKYYLTVLNYKVQVQLPPNSGWLDGYGEGGKRDIKEEEMERWREEVRRERRRKISAVRRAGALGITAPARAFGKNSI